MIRFKRQLNAKAKRNVRKRQLVTGPVTAAAAEEFGETRRGDQDVRRGDADSRRGGG